MAKKVLLVFVLVLFLPDLFAEEANQIVRENLILHSEELNSDISIVVYDPYNIDEDEQVTIIFYIFGDFLFHPFSGAMYYLSNELNIIPKTILVGINEIEGKQIGSYQKEYASFITDDLIDYFSKKYFIKSDCVLFGHSRATRLVAEVMQYDSKYISNFILSAPWLSEQQLGDLDNSLKARKNEISVFITQSEEDLGRDAVKDANQKLLQILHRYETKVRSKYQYFEGEIHMSIPPLSYYYGIKHQLR